MFQNKIISFLKKQIQLNIKINAWQCEWTKKSKTKNKKQLEHNIIKGCKYKEVFENKILCGVGMPSETIMILYLINNENLLR